MGLKTLDDFRASVNFALGDKSQFDERLDDWINDGLQELFSMLDIEARRTVDSVNTVASTETITLPVDLIALLNVSDRTNKRRVLKVSIENFEQYDPTDEGEPKWYARVDRDLFLHPVPDDVYQLDLVYIKYAAVLTAGSDVTNLDPVYDRIVHLLAVRSALVDLHEDERATFYHQIARNRLGDISTAFELEAAAPAKGIEIARSHRDLSKPPSHPR